MRRAMTAILLMAIGGLLTVGAFGFHIVRSSSGDFIIWKSRPSLHDAYVDTRDWPPGEWKLHPEFLKALREAGRENVIPKPSLLDPLHSLMRKLRGGEPKQPSRVPLWTP